METPNNELSVSQVSSRFVCKLLFDSADRASTAADMFWKAQIALSNKKVFVGTTLQTWSGRWWLTHDRSVSKTTKLDIYPN